MLDDRRRELLELIRAKGFAALPELAEKLGVSESTVRRDLNALEAEGSARRTHGGVFYTGPSPKLQHFELTQSQNWEAKRAIAAIAADLVEDGDTILLDGGSTTYEVARLLVGRAIQVVTNSLPVANLFSGDENTDLIVLGGYIHGRTGVSLGPYTVQMLSRLNCRRAFLSVAGVQQPGFYNSNLLLVETEQAMIAAADQKVIVADSTKFGRTSLARLCALDEVDLLVVDHRLSKGWRKMLMDSGIDLRLAPALTVVPAAESS